MIYLFYGTDTYRSQQKLREVIAEYRVKNGNLNFEQFDAEELSESDMRRALEPATLFPSKRLVVLKYVAKPLIPAEPFLKLLEPHQQIQDMVLLIWDPNDFKKAPFLKDLAKITDHPQEFRPYDRAALAHWVRAGASQRKVALSREEVEKLCTLGPDLWRLHHELEKKVLMGNQVLPRQEASKTVFDLGDSFFGAPSSSLKVLLELLYNGEEEAGLFAYCTNHARRLLVTKSFVEKGETVPAAFGFHPFVLKKMTAAAKNISHPIICSAVRRFFEEDRKIKLGQTRHAEALTRMLMRAK